MSTEPGRLKAQGSGSGADKVVIIGYTTRAEMLPGNHVKPCKF